MKKEDIIKLLSFLGDYKVENDQPVIILGPDRTKKSKLRIYAYGGRIGRISTRAGNCELLSEAYGNYLSDSEKARKFNKILTENKDNPFSEEYLELAVEAAKDRFEKNDKTSGERRIQTQIVKNYMKGKVDWCVIDMEFRISAKDGLDKPSQVDIVVYDKEKGFGLIELKYNNKSCENLEDHCKSYQKMCSDPKIHQVIEKELIRRAGYLSEYGVIDSRYYDEMKKMALEENGIKLWYGCLFVSGGKSRAKMLVQQIDTAVIDDQCRFSYAEEEDISNIDLRYDEMKSYIAFLNS